MYNQSRFWNLTKPRLRDVIDEMKARKANVRMVRDFLPDGRKFVHVVAFGDSAEALQVMVDTMGVVSGEQAGEGSMQRMLDPNNVEAVAAMTVPQQLAHHDEGVQDLAVNALLGLRWELLDPKVQGDMVRLQEVSREVARKLLIMAGGTPEFGARNEAEAAATGGREQAVGVSVASSVAVQVVEGDG